MPQQYNDMQIIKRRFFAMRNGVLADTLRSAGLGYRMIFGLNLPQITEIANETPPSVALAEDLWADRRTRESMLMAPMIYPRDAMNRATALRWLREASTVEVADVLCLKLLRYVADASEIAVQASDDEDPMARYTSLRLMLNLLMVSPMGRELAGRFYPIAVKEIAREEPLTQRLAAQLKGEIDYMLEG